ncbi:hypothetical protein MUP01_11920 [Candidatus Bathyarchaeota archaeon]|nr:hypothetical protein [Candidatus Bathyarchaeota archaeon]
MSKKPFNVKLSDEDLKFLLQHGKGKTEALENILQKLRTAETQPYSDIPMGSSTGLLDPSLPKETLEARKELLEACKRQELHQYIPPPCPFCAKISETEIECGKELKKGKKPLQMSTISCLTCWDRKEYIRKKVEKQKDNEPEPKPQPQKTESRSVEGSTEFRGYLREWNCRKLGTKFAYVKTPELKDKLPCLQDPTIICAEKIYPENPKSITCRELIANKIQIEAPELIKELAQKTIATFSKPKVEGEA